MTVKNAQRRARAGGGAAMNGRELMRLPQDEAGALHRLARKRVAVVLGALQVVDARLGPDEVGAADKRVIQRNFPTLLPQFVHADAAVPAHGDVNAPRFVVGAGRAARRRLHQARIARHRFKADHIHARLHEVFAQQARIHAG